MTVRYWVLTKCSNSISLDPMPQLFHPYVADRASRRAGQRTGAPRPGAGTRGRPAPPRPATAHPLASPRASYRPGFCFSLKLRFEGGHISCKLPTSPFFPSNNYKTSQTFYLQIFSENVSKHFAYTNLRQVSWSYRKNYSDIQWKIEIELTFKILNRNSNRFSTSFSSFFLLVF